MTRRVVFVAFFNILTLSAEPLSLRRAAELTLEHNQQIAAEQHAVASAEQIAKSKVGLFLPKIELNSTFLHTQHATNISLDPLKSLLQIVDIPQLSNLDLNYNLLDRNLCLLGGYAIQPIFTGGKIIAANRAARLTLAATESTATATRLATLTTLVERYFATVLSHAAVAVRQKVVAALEQHRNDVKTLIDNGLATTTDILYTEYRLAAATSELRREQLLLRTAERALATTIGIDSLTTATTPLFVVHHLERIEQLTETALKNNPELEYARNLRALANVGVAASRADFFPTIAAVAGGGFTHGVTDILPRWVVGISLSFKIFDGLQREHNHLAARSSLRRAEQLEQWAESNIVLKTESLYNATQSHLMQTLALENSITFARELLNSRRVAFAEGMTTTAELLDAVAMVAAAEIEQLKSAYNFDISLMQLLECMGVSDIFFDYSESDYRQIIEYETH